MAHEAFWDIYSPRRYGHYLLHIIHNHPAFVGELDYMTKNGDRIIGNVVCVKGIIHGDNGQDCQVLSLGPISAPPQYQRSGVGEKMIEHTKKIARNLGYGATLLCGDPDYYSRRGFIPAEELGIRTADNMYAAALRACKLYKGVLNGISGRYVKDEIYETDESTVSHFDQKSPERGKIGGTPSQLRFLELVAMRRSVRSSRFCNNDKTRYSRRMSILSEVEMMQKIGSIGLGIMGTPIARFLLKVGYQVNVYARTDVHVKLLAEEGGIARQAPEEIAEHSGVIITMLPGSRAVGEVIFGENGVYKGLDEEKIFMDMSSSDYASTQRIGKRPEKKGVRMLGALVIGGARGAAEGTLTVMVGGDVDTPKQVCPMLEVIRDRIIPVGPVGSGDIAKACSQMLFALNLNTASEVLTLAVKAGLDPQILIFVVNSGSGEGPTGRVKMENFTFKRNFKPGFTMDLMAKDVDMALDMARNLQVPMKLGNLARGNIRVIQNRGFGSDDCSSIIRVVEQKSDVVIRPLAGNDE